MNSLRHPSARASRLRGSSLEILEPRIAPAATAVLIDGPDKDGILDTLRIRGGAGAETVTITDNDAGGSIDVVSGTLDRTFPTTGTPIEHVLVSLGGGNDKVTYTIPDNSLNSKTRVITVNVAGGNDTIEFTAGRLSAATLDLRIIGSGGSDTVGVTFGAITSASKINIHGSLGSGVDPSFINFTGRIENPNTTVQSYFDLGTGNNEFTSTFGAGAFFLNANNGQVLRSTVVGSDRPGDRDNVTAFMNGRVDSFLAYDARLGRGNDSSLIGINYNADVGVVAFGGQLRLGVDGGAGNDTITVNHNRPTGIPSVGGDGAFVTSPNTLLELDLAGGIGDDTILVDLGDGGLVISNRGTLLVRIDGDTGADDPFAAGRDTITMFLTAAADSNSVSPAILDVLIRAGDGEDTLAFQLTNNSATPFYNILTVVDGGAGEDTFAGNALRVIRCP